MTLTLKQLEILNAVVVSGAMTKAKKLTGLSQPTISQQLAKMEDSLGTPLLVRSRTDKLVLTPAGEHWYRVSVDLLARMESAQSHHLTRYSDGQMELKIGLPPTLQGTFAKELARISLDLKVFSRVDFHWVQASTEALQMLDSRLLSCAVVSGDSITSQRNHYHATPLFQDDLVWLVPKAVPCEIVIGAMQGEVDFDRDYSALFRYVDVHQNTPWQQRSEDWFRSRLPQAVRYFSFSRLEPAVSLVSDNLATLLCPRSYLSNLSEADRDSINVFHADEARRDFFFVTLNHYRSLKAYSDLEAKLTNFAQNSYSLKRLSDPSATRAEIVPFSLTPAINRKLVLPVEQEISPRKQA